MKKHATRSPWVFFHAACCSCHNGNLVKSRKCVGVALNRTRALRGASERNALWRVLTSLDYMGRHHRYYAAGAILLLGIFSGVAGALAEFPILHEQFDPDPQEDIAMGVRVTAAGLPAAIQGGSGTLPVPSPTRPIDHDEPAYSERQASAPKTFAIDSTTADPGRLSYHEPFRPSIAPFKRTHVFDAVNVDFELIVADARPRPAAIGGTPGSSDDQFFADLVVNLVPGELTRVPSVGARMMVYSAHLEPPTPFGFYVDRAENWFVRAPEGAARSRLIMHVGAPRAVFDDRIEASSYSGLAAHLPPLPSNVERVASQLLQRIGVSRVLAPADALSLLVTYFRGFAASTDYPNAKHGEALYRQLVLSKKGVCRHRAYAFVITAMGLGIPARFVHNEAHAWVEVFGGVNWHRIDLGGAASSFDYKGEPPPGSPHLPPPDAYQWPRSSQAAQQSLPVGAAASPGSGVQNAPSGSASAAADQNAPSTTLEPSNPGPGAANHAAPASPISAANAQAPSGNTPEYEQSVAPREPTVASGKGTITFKLLTAPELQRGERFVIEGRVAAPRADCDHLRIDAAFVAGTKRYAAGSATTDGSGSFSASLSVPSELPVGKYDLILSTPGTKHCPAAVSE
jgi:hypothetical protein